MTIHLAFTSVPSRWPDCHIEHIVLPGEARNGERWPILWQTWLNAEALGLGRETQKTVEHHLRQQDAFHVLPQ